MGCTSFRYPRSRVPKEEKITHSQVLPGLAISLLEEAFRRTRQMNHGKVSAWLLTQFQQ